MAVVLVGTLDTKGAEVAFVRDRIRAEGLETRVIDAGSLGPPGFEPDIGREAVFRRAGTSLEEISARGDRGFAVARAAEGVAALAVELDARGEIEGILALGGSAGTTIGTAAMRALPFGRPKVMVSTLASGPMRPYVGGSDIAVFHPVADLAGLNRLTRTALAHAAAALVGMVRARPVLAEEGRPLVGATMFGVTTPCVDRARARLEGAGFEVLVFHATGVGGQAMEGLIRDGRLAGVLDLTTTELADELVGGILSAGPDRLRAAARRGVPQVVSVGALDMVNFGPLATVPDRFAGRRLHAHNPNVTLMRTTPAENQALGALLAESLAEAPAPTVVMLPLRGVSALDAQGGPFFDPEADGALFRAISDGLARSPATVRLIARDEHINDPAFADAAADTLIDLLSTDSPRR